MQDLAELGRMVGAKIGLSHLWIQGNECPLRNGALNSHVTRRKAVEDGGQRLKSSPVQEGSGLHLGSLVPIIAVYWQQKYFEKSKDWPVST